MVEIGGEREFLRENVTDQERERECLRERGFGGAAERDRKKGDCKYEEKNIAVRENPVRPSSCRMMPCT